MTRTMFDGVTPSGMPTGAPLYAYYVDGIYANGSAVKARFPGKTYVGIAVKWTTRAQVLDVEQGDATEAQALLWCTQTMSDVPNNELTLYGADWAKIRQIFGAAGVALPQQWLANWDGDPSLPAGCVAKQWKNTANYDQSVVADYWPGVDSAPTPVPVPVPNVGPVPVTPVVSTEENGMFVVQYPSNTPDWKGDFLFTGGKLTHIVKPATEAALVALGVPVKRVTADAFNALLSEFGS